MPPGTALPGSEPGRSGGTYAHRQGRGLLQGSGGLLQQVEFAQFGLPIGFPPATVCISHYLAG